MAELIRFYETVGRTAEKAFHVGQVAAGAVGFVVDHLKTGVWGDLPHAEPGPSHPPQRAHIEHITTGDNHAE